MSLPKTVFSNTLFQLITRFISSSSTFILTVFLARALGASGFGEFATITTIVTFFYLVIDFGLNPVFVAETDAKKFSRNLGSFFLVRMILALGIILFLNAGLFLTSYLSPARISPTVFWGVLVLSSTIFAQSLLVTANSVLQKNLAYHYSMYAITLGSIGMLVAFFCFQPFTVFNGIFAVAIGSWIMALISVFFAHRLLPFRLVWDQMFVRKLLRSGMLLGITLVATVIMNYADRFALILTRSVSEVGAYSLAYKFFEFPLSLPTFVMNSLFPVLIADHALSKTQFFKRSKTAFFVLLALSGLSIFLCFLGAPFLVLIKKDFGASINTFRFLSLTLPFFFLTSLFQWMMVAVGKYRQLLIVYSASMVGSLFLAFLLVPRYGMNGAVLTTGISEVFVLIMLGVLLWKNMKV